MRINAEMAALVETVLAAYCRYCSAAAEAVQAVARDVDATNIISTCDFFTPECQSIFWCKKTHAGICILLSTGENTVGRLTGLNLTISQKDDGHRIRLLGNPVLLVALVSFAIGVAVYPTDKACLIHVDFRRFFVLRFAEYSQFFIAHGIESRPAAQ